MKVSSAVITVLGRFEIFSDVAGMHAIDSKSYFTGKLLLFHLAIRLNTA